MQVNITSEGAPHNTKLYIDGEVVPGVLLIDIHPIDEHSDTVSADITVRVDNVVLGPPDQSSGKGFAKEPFTGPLGA